ncbi:MAG TPA: hypothetical protein VGA69_07550 [Nitriliruptorales bacterium]
MNRRASLPGADELFRPTGGPAPGAVRPLREAAAAPPAQAGDQDTTPAEASGRVRHDEKITVYLVSQELLDLEQARLRLRAEFGISIDRGRIVREAVGELLADLRDNGPDSAIVRRTS